MLAPTLAHNARPLHLAGRSSPEASHLSPVPTCSSRFGAAGISPEGAAAPAAWKAHKKIDQFRGSCLKRKINA